MDSKNEIKNWVSRGCKQEEGQAFVWARRPAEHGVGALLADI